MNDTSDDNDENETQDDEEIQNPLNEFNQNLGATLQALDQINNDYSKLFSALDQYQDINRKVNRALLAIDFDQFDRALATAVNPKLFRQVEALEQTAVLDMYKVVAATRKVEAETAEEEGIDEVELEVADSVESTYYDLIATYVSNAGDSFPSGVHRAADSILSSDQVQEKRDYAVDLFQRADEQTRAILVSVTWMCIQVIFTMFLADSSSEDD